MSGNRNEVETGDGGKEINANQTRQYCQEGRSTPSDSESKSNAAHNTDFYKTQHNRDVISHSFPQSNDQDLQHIESSKRAVPVVIQQRYGASA